MRQVIFLFFVFNFYSGLFLAFPPRAQAALDTKEISGIILSVKFGDPFEEPYFHRAKIEVVDAGGTKILLSITTATLIRDPLWHSGKVTYLKEGMKVNARYLPQKTEPYPAKAIYVVKEHVQEFKP